MTNSILRVDRNEIFTIYLRASSARVLISNRVSDFFIGFNHVEERLFYRRGNLPVSYFHLLGIHILEAEGMLLDIERVSLSDLPLGFCIYC